VDNRVKELEHAIVDLSEQMDHALDVLPSAGVVTAVPTGIVTIASASPVLWEDTPPSLSTKMLDFAQWSHPHTGWHLGR